MTKYKIIDPFDNILDKTQTTESSNKLYEQQETERRDRELAKQNRIARSQTDKYIHTINVIIEWSENSKNKSISIDYYFFNFEDSWMVARNLFEPFLDKLKSFGCFHNWVGGGTTYAFTQVDRAKLNEYKTIISPHDAIKEKKGKVLKDKRSEKFALFLSFKGDRLYISGNAIESKQYLIQKVIQHGSGVIIEPLLKLCASRRTTFKTITKKGLRDNSFKENTELEKAIRDSSGLKKYISNIGFIYELRDLFYANSPSGLGFKFRTAVSQEVWHSLSRQQKEKIVKRISKFQVNKK